MAAVDLVPVALDGTGFDREGLPHGRWIDELGLEIVYTHGLFDYKVYVQDYLEAPECKTTNAEGKLHSIDDRPARIFSNRGGHYFYWYKNGRHHRDVGPSSVYIEAGSGEMGGGSVAWSKDGRHHRIGDLPSTSEGGIVEHISSWKQEDEHCATGRRDGMPSYIEKFGSDPAFSRWYFRSICTTTQAGFDAAREAWIAAHPPTKAARD